MKYLISLITKCKPLFELLIKLKITKGIIDKIIVSIIALGVSIFYNYNYNWDRGGYAQQVKNTRKWLEDQLDIVCLNKKTCDKYVRSFYYQKKYHNKAWCLGHRNMIIDKDYFEKKYIHLDTKCIDFIESYPKYILIDYATIKNYCYDLATKCLFNDPKYPNNTKISMVCKHGINNGNFECMSIVNGENLIEYIHVLDQFLLDNSLTYF